MTLERIETQAPMVEPALTTAPPIMLRLARMPQLEPSPDRDSLARIYRDELRSQYLHFAERLQLLLQELTDRAGIPIVQLEYRAKTLESFLHKIDLKAYADPLHDIFDFAGIRIISYYNDDTQRIAELIAREFIIHPEHSVDKTTTLSVDEFGYRSIHLVVTLKDPRRTLPEWSRFGALRAEIQVRSVLQHAWASISHKLDYKVASQAPTELRRRLFRLSALLELADQEFSDFRDSSRAVQQRYRQELGRGDLDIPLNLNSLREFLRSKGELAFWEQTGISSGMLPHPDGIAFDRTNQRELDRLLGTLTAAGMTLVSDLERAIPTLTRISTDSLRSFMASVASHGGRFVAIAIDILAILVRISFEMHGQPSQPRAQYPLFNATVEAAIEAAAARAPR